jgi:hypothetical protein
MEPGFDSPDNDEVLQVDEQPLEAIPVEIRGVVQTDEMPSRRATFRTVVLRAGTDAQKIANDNPRRKRLVLWVPFNLDSEITCASIADNYGESQSFSGALVTSGPNSVVARYEFGYSGELFARPCVVTDATGILTAIVVSTQDLLLCICEEDWAT